MSSGLLISIKPFYAEKILRGEKTIELRRTKPNLCKDAVALIYASMPTCALVGAAIISKIEVAKPTPLWAAVRSQAGIIRPDYDDYFFGASEAVAIHLSRAVRLKAPIRLSQLRKKVRSFRPPQSFSYVRAGLKGLSFFEEVIQLLYPDRQVIGESLFWGRSG